MKRKEEIELAWLSKAVQSNHRYDEKSFKEAIEWSDKTMIEKACEWLEQNAVQYESGTKMGYIPFNMIEDMINDFKQAMEE